VLAQCLRQDGTFQLRALIHRQRPVFTAGTDTGYHTTTIPEIDREALRHFAAGVFWKASVTHWRAPVGGVTLRNSLGPRYEEAFRLYLSGAAPFPARARLMIWLCGEPDPPYIVLFPDTVRGIGHHAHRFFLPGLCFHMIVGGILPSDVPPIWGDRADEVPIFVHHQRTDGVHQDVFALVRKPTKAGVRRARNTAV
jgi:hypothetical protein